jgi:hypothetical protein
MNRPCCIGRRKETIELDELMVVGSLALFPSAVMMTDREDDQRLHHVVGARPSLSGMVLESAS